MIKKLRLKFILAAMTAVSLVLISIIAAINISNYCKIITDSDKIIGLLIENGGMFPQNTMPHKPGGINDMSPETPFQTRYFSVKITSEKEAIIIDVNHIAAISEANAKEYAEELYSKKKYEGMVDGYRYNSKTENGETLYVFVDCSRDLETFQNFLLMSILISIGGLLVVLVLVILFSKIVLKPVEESYKKQKSFITNASHDIKTPLTIIHADAEVLELEHGSSEWTENIKKQIVRLTSLTEKLIFLSRMEESQEQLEMKAFDLSAVMEETCFPYEAFCKPRELTLELDIQPEVTYFGNEDMITQVIALLMDNAIKYTNSQGWIAVSLKKVGKACVLNFRNQVETIEQGNHNELFDRFYRAEGSRNSEMGGHGIGLSVVKAIVQSHKGKITAHSVDGKSIDFNITL